MKEGQEWKNLNKEDQKTEKKGKGQMKRQTKMKKGEKWRPKQRRDPRIKEESSWKEV